jgi:hypothetical protein
LLQKISDYEQRHNIPLLPQFRPPYAMHGDPRQGRFTTPRTLCLKIIMNPTPDDDEARRAVYDYTRNGLATPAKREAFWAGYQAACRRGDTPVAYRNFIRETVERTCTKRIEEIEGRVPTNDEVSEHLIMEVVPENFGFARMLWKGQHICEYHPPGYTPDGWVDARVLELSPKETP